MKFFRFSLTNLAAVACLCLIAVAPAAADPVTSVGGIVLTEYGVGETGSLAALVAQASVLTVLDLVVLAVVVLLALWLAIRLTKDTSARTDPEPAWFMADPRPPI